MQLIIFSRAANSRQLIKEARNQEARYTRWEIVSYGSNDSVRDFRSTLGVSDGDDDDDDDNYGNR